MKISEAYQKEISYLETIGNVSQQPNYQDKILNKKLFIIRLKYLLRHLGNPHKKIKKYIHIGGTSGKGSTANFIHEIIIASGKKSFLFTSPFLTETIEKYKINKNLTSIGDFVWAINKVKPAINECSKKSNFIPSYFEVCFAIAIILYHKNNCEYFVSEVGLGGEFDATNIVDKKIITAITHVDYDHMHILGNSLKQIATTKSKIISRKSSFFTVEKRPHIRSIFINECRNKNSSYHYVKPNYSNLKLNKENFEFSYQNIKYSLYHWGQHQVENAILAIEIAKKLKIDKKSISRGIRNTKIPGRFEIISHKPTIILDVAHNYDKLKTVIDNIGLINYKKLHIIFALAENKDNKKPIQLLSQYANRITITKFFNPYRKCLNPKYIYNRLVRQKPNIDVCIDLDPWKALENSIKHSGSKDIILICGSFYLVGELRKKWHDCQKIIKNKKVI